MKRFHIRGLPGVGRGVWSVGGVLSILVLSICEHDFNTGTDCIAVGTFSVAREADR